MSIDQVSVQGKPSTSKSVTQYYVKTSKDGSNFNYIVDGSGPKVRQSGNVRNHRDVIVYF